MLLPPLHSHLLRREVFSRNSQAGHVPSSFLVVHAALLQHPSQHTLILHHVALQRPEGVRCMR